MMATNKLESLLTIFKDKRREEYGNVIYAYLDDIKLIDDIVEVIEKKHSTNVCESVFELLFILFSDGEENVQKFCMNFLPSIIWSHYSFLAVKHKSLNSSKIDAILLSIFNKMVDTNTEEEKKKNTFQIPRLTKPSIYHEPMFLHVSAAMHLTENSLTQHEKADLPIHIAGPTKHIDRIPAGLRPAVMKTVLLEYNSYLSCVTESSLVSLCNLVVRLSTMGYHLKNLQYDLIQENEMNSLSKYGRPKLHSDIIEQFITGLHFAMYDGLNETARSALLYLQERCRYSLSYTGMLNINALLDLSNLSTDENDYFCLPVINASKMKYRNKTSMNATDYKKQPSNSFTSNIPITPIKSKKQSLKESNSILSASKIETTFQKNLHDDEKNHQENIMLETLKSIKNDSMDSNPEQNNESISNNKSIKLHLEDGKEKSVSRNVSEEEFDKSTDKTPLINGVEDNSSNDSTNSNKMLLTINSIKQDNASSVKYTVDAVI